MAFYHPSFYDFRRPQAGRLFQRLAALVVILSFVFPYLTWAFTAGAFQTQPMIYFQQQTVEIPSAIGKITNQFQGRERLVIHIQDLHCNYEVQSNIANLLKIFSQQYGLNLVCIEGASRAVNVGKLGSFPLQAVKAEVGEYFMRAGKVSGAEYYAALSSRDIRLEGIENAEHYLASRECLDKFLQDENQGYVWDLREQLEELKGNIYSPALAAFDQARTRFRKGEMSLWKYGQYLEQAAGRAGAGQAAGPELKKYLAKAAGVDSEALQLELDVLDQAVRERLYTHEKQRLLDELEQRLDVVEKLLNISATPEEVAEVVNHRTDYQAGVFTNFIRQEAVAMDVETGGLDTGVEEALEFYALADQRSTDFVENMQARMKESQTGLAVLITGGYHTAEILKQLQAQGMSYVSIQPKVTHQDLVNPYFSLLRKQRTPLEKLLAQNQKVLSLEPYFAECPAGQANAVLDEDQLSSEQQSRNDVLEAALKVDLAQSLRESGAQSLEKLKTVFESLVLKYRHGSAQVQVDIRQGVLGRAASLFPVKIRKLTLCALIGSRASLSALPGAHLQTLQLKNKELRFYPVQAMPRAAAGIRLQSGLRTAAMKLGSTKELLASWQRIPSTDAHLISRLLRLLATHSLWGGSIIEEFGVKTPGRTLWTSFWQSRLPIVSVPLAYAAFVLPGLDLAQVMSSLAVIAAGWIYGAYQQYRFVGDHPQTLPDARPKRQFAVFLFNVVSLAAAYALVNCLLSAHLSLPIMLAGLFLAALAGPVASTVAHTFWNRFAPEDYQMSIDASEPGTIQDPALTLETAGELAAKSSVELIADDGEKFSFVLNDFDRMKKGCFRISVFHGQQRVGEVFVTGNIVQFGKVWGFPAIRVKAAYRQQYSGIGNTLMGLAMALVKSRGYHEFRLLNVAKSAAGFYYRRLNFLLADPTGASKDRYVDFNLQPLPVIGIQSKLLRNLTVTGRDIQEHRYTAVRKRLMDIRTILAKDYAMAPSATVTAKIYELFKALDDTPELKRLESAWMRAMRTGTTLGNIRTDIQSHLIELAGEAKAETMGKGRQRQRVQDRNRLQEPPAQKQLRILYGGLQVWPALSAMLSSLGTFSQDAKITRLPDKHLRPGAIFYPRDRPGYIPFKLHDPGRMFLKDILGSDLSPEAYVLVFQSSEKYYQEQLSAAGLNKGLPLGILFKTDDGRETCFLDLAEFLLPPEVALNFRGAFKAGGYLSSLWPGAPHPRHLALKREKTRIHTMDPAISRELQTSYGGDGNFELLALVEIRNAYGPNRQEDGLGLMSARDPGSGDFRNRMSEMRPLFRGKMIGMQKDPQAGQIFNGIRSVQNRRQEQIPDGLDPEEKVKLQSVLSDIDGTLTLTNTEPVAGEHAEALLQTLEAGVPVLLISGSPYSPQLPVRIYLNRHDASQFQEMKFEYGRESLSARLDPIIKQAQSKELQTGLTIISTKENVRVTFSVEGAPRYSALVDQAFTPAEQIDIGKALALAYWQQLNAVREDAVGNRMLEKITEAGNLLEVMEHFNAAVRAHTNARFVLSDGEIEIQGLDHIVDGNQAMDQAVEWLNQWGYDFKGQKGSRVQGGSLYANSGPLYFKITLFNKAESGDAWLNEHKAPGAVLAMGDSGTDNFLWDIQRPLFFPVYLGKANQVNRHPRVIVARDAENMDQVKYTESAKTWKHFLEAAVKGLKYKQLKFIDNRYSLEDIESSGTGSINGMHAAASPMRLSATKKLLASWQQATGAWAPVKRFLSLHSLWGGSLIEELGLKAPGRTLWTSFWQSRLPILSAPLAYLAFAGLGISLANVAVPLAIILAGWIYGQHRFVEAHPNELPDSRPKRQFATFLFNLAAAAPSILYLRFGLPSHLDLTAILVVMALIAIGPVLSVLVHTAWNRFQPEAYQMQVKPGEKAPDEKRSADKIAHEYEIIMKAAAHAYERNPALSQVEPGDMRKTLMELDEMRRQGKVEKMALGSLVMALFAGKRMPEGASQKVWQMAASAYNAYLKSPLLQSYKPRDLLDTLQWLAKNAAILPPGKEKYIQGWYVAGKIPHSRREQWERAASAYDFYESNACLQSFAAVAEACDQRHADRTTLGKRLAYVREVLDWLKARKGEMNNLDLNTLIIALYVTRHLPSDITMQEWQHYANAYEDYLRYFGTFATFASNRSPHPLPEVWHWYVQHRQDIQPLTLESTTAALVVGGRLPGVFSLKNLKLNAVNLDYYSTSPVLQAYQPVDMTLTLDHLRKNHHALDNRPYPRLISSLAMAGKIPQAELETWLRSAAAYQFYFENALMQSYTPVEKIPTYDWLLRHRGELNNLSLATLIMSFAIAGKLPAGENASIWQRDASLYERALAEESVIGSEIERIWSSPALDPYRDDLTRLRLNFDPAKLTNSKTGKPVSGQYRRNVLDWAYKLYGQKLITELRLAQMESSRKLYRRMSFLRDFKTTDSVADFQWLLARRGQWQDAGLVDLVRALFAAGKFPKGMRLAPLERQVLLFERALRDEELICGEIKRIFTQPRIRVIDPLAFLKAKIDRNLLCKENTKDPLNESTRETILGYAFELYGRPLISETMSRKTTKNLQMRMSSTGELLQAWKLDTGKDIFARGKRFLSLHSLWGGSLIEEFGVRSPGRTLWTSFWQSRLPILSVPLAYLAYAGLGIGLDNVAVPLAIILAGWIYGQHRFVEAHPNGLPDSRPKRQFTTFLFNLAAAAPGLVYLKYLMPSELTLPATLLALVFISAGPIASTAVHTLWNRLQSPEYRMGVTAPAPEPKPDRLSPFLDNMLENYPAKMTLKTILSSLGEPAPGESSDFIPAREETGFAGFSPEDKAGGLAFHLKPEGLMFFQELLHIPVIAPEAYILTLESRRPQMQEMFVRAGVASGMPYALLFSNPDKTEFYVFDLSEFILAPGDAAAFHAFSQAVAIGEKLLPKAARARHLILILEDTPSVTGAQADQKMRRLDFNGKFRMLRVVEKRPYSGKEVVKELVWLTPEAEHNRIFQDMLTKARYEFPGNRVGITHVGLGQDLLLALRLGAKAVYANEQGRVPWQLAVWNHQYARETGQVPAPDQDDVRIILGQDFAGIPEDIDLHIYNAPPILTPEEIKVKTDGRAKAKDGSNFLNRQDFTRVFEVLQARLQKHRTRAIWRITASPSLGLAKVTEEDLQRRGGFHTDKGKLFTRQQMQAERMLWQANLGARQIGARHLIYQFHDLLAGNQAVQYTLEVGGRNLALVVDDRIGFTPETLGAALQRALGSPESEVGHLPPYTTLEFGSMPSGLWSDGHHANGALTLNPLLESADQNDPVVRLLTLAAIYHIFCRLSSRARETEFQELQPGRDAAFLLPWLQKYGLGAKEVEAKLEALNLPDPELIRSLETAIAKDRSRPEASFRYGETQGLGGSEGLEIKDTVQRKTIPDSEVEINYDRKTGCMLRAIVTIPDGRWMIVELPEEQNGYYREGELPKDMIYRVSIGRHPVISTAGELTFGQGEPELSIQPGYRQDDVLRRAMKQFAKWCQEQKIILLAPEIIRNMHSDRMPAALGREAVDSARPAPEKAAEKLRYGPVSMRADDGDIFTYQMEKAGLKADKKFIIRAFRGDEEAGWVVVQGNELDARESGFKNAIEVAPKFDRQYSGIGTTLLSLSLAEVKSRGYDKMTVIHADKYAMGFYERNGFEYVDRMNSKDMFYDYSKHALPALGVVSKILRMLNAEQGSPAQSDTAGIQTALGAVFAIFSWPDAIEPGPTVRQRVIQALQNLQPNAAVVKGGEIWLAGLQAGKTFLEIAGELRKQERKSWMQLESTAKYLEMMAYASGRSASLKHFMAAHPLWGGSLIEELGLKASGRTLWTSFWQSRLPILSVPLAYLAYAGLGISLANVAVPLAVILAGWIYGQNRFVEAHDNRLPDARPKRQFATFLFNLAAAAPGLAYVKYLMPSELTLPAMLLALGFIAVGPFLSTAVHTLWNRWQPPEYQMSEYAVGAPGLGAQATAAQLLNDKKLILTADDGQVFEYRYESHPKYNGYGIALYHNGNTIGYIHADSTGIYRKHEPGGGDAVWVDWPFRKAYAGLGPSLIILALAINQAPDKDLFCVQWPSQSAKALYKELGFEPKRDTLMEFAYRTKPLPQIFLVNRFLRGSNNAQASLDAGDYAGAAGRLEAVVDLLSTRDILPPDDGMRAKIISTFEALQRVQKLSERLQFWLDELRQSQPVNVIRFKAGLLNIMGPQRTVKTDLAKEKEMADGPAKATNPSPEELSAWLQAPEKITSGQLVALVDHIERGSIKADLQQWKAVENAIIQCLHMTNVDIAQHVIDQVLEPPIPSAPKEKLDALFDPDFEPYGTFHMGQRLGKPPFLKEADSQFMRPWLKFQLEPELEKMKKAEPARMRALEYLPGKFDLPLWDLVYLMLFLKLPDGSRLLDNIPNNIYQDVFTRMMSIFIWRHPFAYPYTERDFNMKMAKVMQNLLPRIAGLNLSLKDLFAYTVAAGALGLDLKSNASAASTINTNNVIPYFTTTAETENQRSERMFENLRKNAARPLAIDCWDDFEQRFASGKKATLAWFHDDYGETQADLLFIQALLLKNPNLTVVSIPRSGSFQNRFGNDANDVDLFQFVSRLSMFGLQKNLFGGSRRYQNCSNGPYWGAAVGTQFSEEVADILAKSDGIVVKGARSYELLSGINVPAYYAYMVCREFSETTTGIDWNTGLSVFIRQEPGLPTFQGFRQRHMRQIPMFDTGKMDWAALMTAREYVAAISSRQYQQILERFQSDRLAANRWIKAESRRLGITIAEVIEKYSLQNNNGAGSQRSAATESAAPNGRSEAQRYLDQIPPGFKPEEKVKIKAVVMDIDLTITPNSKAGPSEENLAKIKRCLEMGIDVLLISGSAMFAEEMLTLHISDQETVQAKQNNPFTLEHRIAKIFTQALAGHPEHLAHLTIKGVSGMQTLTFDSQGHYQVSKSVKKAFSPKEQADFGKALALGYLKTYLKQRLPPNRSEAEIAAAIEEITRAKNIVEIRKIFGRVTTTLLVPYDVEILVADRDCLVDGDTAMQQAIIEFEKLGYKVDSISYFLSSGKDYLKISCIRKTDEVRDWIKTLPQAGAVIGIGDSASTDDFLFETGENYFPVFLRSAREVEKHPRVIVARDKQGKDHVGHIGTGDTLGNIVAALEKELTFMDFRFFDNRFSLRELISREILKYDALGKIASIAENSKVLPKPAIFNLGLLPPLALLVVAGLGLMQGAWGWEYGLNLAGVLVAALGLGYFAYRLSDLRQYFRPAEAYTGDDFRQDVSRLRVLAPDIPWTAEWKAWLQGQTEDMPDSAARLLGKNLRPPFWRLLLLGGRSSYYAASANTLHFHGNLKSLPLERRLAIVAHELTHYFDLQAGAGWWLQIPLVGGLVGEWRAMRVERSVARAVANTADALQIAQKRQGYSGASHTSRRTGEQQVFESFERWTGAAGMAFLAVILGGGWLLDRFFIGDVWQGMALIQVAGLCALYVRYLFRDRQQLEMAKYNPLALYAWGWRMLGLGLDGLFDLPEFRRNPWILVKNLNRIGFCLVPGVIMTSLELAVDGVISLLTQRPVLAKKLEIAGLALRSSTGISPYKNLMHMIDKFAYARHDNERAFLGYALFDHLRGTEIRQVFEDTPENNIYDAGEIRAYRLLQTFQLHRLAEVKAWVDANSPWVYRNLLPWDVAPIERCLQSFVSDKRQLYGDPAYLGLVKAGWSPDDQALHAALSTDFGVDFYATYEILRMLHLNRPVTANDLAGEMSESTLDRLAAAGVVVADERGALLSPAFLAKLAERRVDLDALRRNLAAPLSRREMGWMFPDGFRAWLTGAGERLAVRLLDYRTWLRLGFIFGAVIVLVDPAAGQSVLLEAVARLAADAQAHLAVLGMALVVGGVKQVKAPARRARAALPNTDFPDELGRYLRTSKDLAILGFTGVGFSGRVYHAQDGSGRDCAIKINLEGKSLDTAEMIKLMARLQGAKHPNLLFPFECDAVVLPSGKRFEYQLMDWVESEPFFDLWQQQAYTPEAEEKISRLFVKLFKQVVGAVAFLHYHGLYHGDIKPSNIIMHQENFILFDFMPMPDGFEFGRRQEVSYLRMHLVEVIKDYALPPALKELIRDVLSDLEKLQPGNDAQYQALLEKIDLQARHMAGILLGNRLLSDARKEKTDLARRAFELGKKIYDLPINTFAADIPFLQVQVRHLERLSAERGRSLRLPATLALTESWRAAQGRLAGVKHFFALHSLWGTGLIEELGLKTSGRSGWTSFWQSRLPVLSVPAAYLAYLALNLPLAALAMPLAIVMAGWIYGAIQQNRYVEAHDNRLPGARQFRQFATFWFNVFAAAPGMAYVYYLQTAGLDPAGIGLAVLAIAAGPVLSIAWHALWNQLAGEKYRMTTAGGQVDQTGPGQHLPASRSTESGTSELEPGRPLSDPGSAFLQAWRLPRLAWMAFLWTGLAACDAGLRAWPGRLTAIHPDPAARAEKLDQLLRQYLPANHLEARFFNPKQWERGFRSGLSWPEKLMGRYISGEEGKPGLYLDESLALAFTRSEGRGFPAWLDRTRSAIAGHLIRQILLFRSAEYYQTGAWQRLQNRLDPAWEDRQYGRAQTLSTANAFGLFGLPLRVWLKVEVSAHWLVQRLLPNAYLRAIQRGLPAATSAGGVAQELLRTDSELHQAYVAMAALPSPDSRLEFACALLKEIVKSSGQEKIAGWLYFSELMQRMKSVPCREVVVIPVASGLEVIRLKTFTVPEIILRSSHGLGLIRQILEPQLILDPEMEKGLPRQRRALSRQAA